MGPVAIRSLVERGVDVVFTVAHFFKLAECSNVVFRPVPANKIRK